MIFFMNFFYMNSKCILWLLSLNIFIFLDIELKYIVICLLENLYVFLKKEKKWNILIDKMFEKNIYW